MSDYQEVPHKRPIGVWLITIFFILSSIVSPLSLYLMLSGAMPLEPAQKAYFDSYTLIDYGSMIVLGLLNLAAAIALFFLRKIARTLFLTALGLNIVLAGWHAATKGWTPAAGGSGWVGALLGYTIIIAACIYAWRLSKKGVLH